MRETIWLPQIDQEECTGCGDCLAACPTNALGLIGSKATLIDVEACTYCGACEVVCPVDAIALPYQIVAADRSNSVEHKRR